MTLRNKSKYTTMPTKQHKTASSITQPYRVVPYDKLQDVHQLRQRVALFDDDLPRPVGQQMVPVLHTRRHGRGQNVQRLPDHKTRFDGVSLKREMVT